MTSFRLFMFPQRGDFPVSLLQLHPIYISGMTRPVLDGDGGINIAVVEQGMFSIIDPYPGMGEGDLIEIFWNGKEIHELKVKLAEVDKRLYFFMPTAEIVPGFAECYYQITRLGEPLPDDPSAVLKLLVKLDKPAGEDKEPFLPWHSELDMVGLPEDVIHNGVTKEWSAKGVPMTIKRYPDMRVRDVIWVRWGGVLLTAHVVSQAEVDGTAEIVITALPGDILTAGDSAELTIIYEVHDEVFNYCEKWSEDTTVVVDAGSARLGEAIFKEADGGELHLDQLDHQAAHLQIFIRENVFDSGDTIDVKVVGIAGPGTAPRTFTAQFILRDPPYIHDEPIPYAFVSLFATGQLDGSYVLRKKDGSVPLYSRRTFVQVIGNPALLPAPSINEVIGAILPVDSQAATVRMSYPSIAVGDTINMIWKGTKSDGKPYAYEEQYDVSNADQQAGFVILYVQSDHILELANGSLKLYYRVYNEETRSYGINESDFLRVEVRDIRATLPAPEVEEAQDGVIDPTLVYTQAHVLVKPVEWSKGDTLTYHWIGVTGFGTTRGSVPITSLSIDKPVRFRVDARYVTANIGYNVKVIYTLLHNATGKYSYSAPFEVMVGIPLGRLQPPTVVQAPAGRLDPMDALNGVDIECTYPTMDETLDTLALKWRGTPGAGTSEDLEKPAEPSGTVTFHLPESFVGANIRRSVGVSHDVMRYSLWTSSEELTLNILDFQNPEKDLPRPEVPQAVAAVLDLMEFIGDARVLVKPWPFTAKGQRASISLEGRSSSGSYIIDVLKNHPISDQQALQGLDETLLRSELLKLLHSSPATVKCKVIFDGSTDEAAAITFPSLPLTIRTRYDYVTPVITKVLNAQGRDIPEAGLTYDKRVTIQGTATRGEKVEVKINNVLKGTPQATALWEWECPVDSLTGGLQTVTVKALYDADEPIGKPRTFTIGIATEPKITKVVDTKGPVGNNGVTYDTEITVTVTADGNQRVQLYDGTAIIGGPIDLNSTGEGSAKLSGLSVKPYLIKARALYGDQLESPSHNFTVRAHTAPTLTSVRHSGGELGQGGATTDSSVTLTGAVTPSYQVQIYDNNVVKHTVPSNASGVWTTTLAIAIGGHSVYARALATGQNSNARSFTRNNPIPPLNFNTSPVTLGGKTYILPAYPSSLPAFDSGNSVRHQATGGSGAITYSSSAPQVAAVDASGFVSARGRGSATITARDGTGQSRSYTVTVTNVIHCHGYGSENWAGANAKVAAGGARIPSMLELHEITVAYSGRWPMGNALYWSTESSNYFWPLQGRKTKNLVTGGHSDARTTGHWANIVGLR